MRSYRTMAVAAALAWAGAPLDVAAATMSWHGDAASAEFGVPETDDRLIRLACDTNRRGSVRILPEIYSSAAPQGPALIVFTVDGKGFERPATYIQDDATGAFRPIVEVRKPDDLLVALTTGRNVVIAQKPPQQGTGKVEVTLRGSGAPIKKMLAGC